MNGFGSRKFIVTMLVETLASVLALFGLISGDNWTTISLANVAAYNVGNVGEAFANRNK